VARQLCISLIDQNRCRPLVNPSLSSLARQSLAFRLSL
jgi:hypothetical protein